MVGGTINLWRGVHAAFAALLPLLGPVALADAAAASSSARTPGAAATDPELRSLVRRARAGDKVAQLELGIRFEEGIGVPVDLKRAERLYRLAAPKSARSIWVYSPPAGGSARGEMLYLGEAEAGHGLAEAAERLDALRRRRIAGGRAR